MDDIAHLFARTDPARTPLNAPLPPQAHALAAEIVATEREGSKRPAPRRFLRWTWPVAAAGAVALLIGVVVLTDLAGPRGNSGLPAEEVPMGDYPWYATEDELAAAADVIIAADVVSSEEQRVDDVPYVIVTVRIDAVAKGQQTPGEQLEVWYPAVTGHVPVGLDPGERVLLFLAVFPDAPASLVNPVQGIYLIGESAGIEPSPQNPVRLSAELLGVLGLVG